jgi:hypothetical protein
MLPHTCSSLAGYFPAGAGTLAASVADSWPDSLPHANAAPTSAPESLANLSCAAHGVTQL